MMVKKIEAMAMCVEHPVPAGHQQSLFMVQPTGKTGASVAPKAIPKSYDMANYT